VHNINVNAKGEEGAGVGQKFRRVDISVPDLPKGFKNPYQIAGHEFGHMLGLHEEYPGKKKSAHYRLVEEAFGKKVAKTFTSRDVRSAAPRSGRRCGNGRAVSHDVGPVPIHRPPRPKRRELQVQD
jgi:hypothetical protein